MNAKSKVKKEMIDEDSARNSSNSKAAYLKSRTLKIMSPKNQQIQTQIEDLERDNESLKTEKNPRKSTTGTDLDYLKIPGNERNVA